MPTFGGALPAAAQSVSVAPVRNESADDDTGPYIHVGPGALIFDANAQVKSGGALLPGATVSIDPNLTVITELGYRWGHVGVSLTGGIPPLATVKGAVVSTLLTDPITIFSLGGSILAPLFEGGRLRAQADVAGARRDQAAFAYRQVALNAFREVEDGMAAQRRDEEQEVALEAQRTALADALRLADNRYRAGYSPYLELLDAQRALLSADLALVQSRTDRLTSAILLYQAVGGGWSAQPVVSAR